MFNDKLSVKIYAIDKYIYIKALNYKYKKKITIICCVIIFFNGN